ncbi:hypothetical protein DAMA08_016830 [Martiniozyma asiatica (nom. inval.)]|nr:hypothetical protein DAMA08_016830 [Martiniozyma asiatica]
MNLDPSISLEGISEHSSTITSEQDENATFIVRTEISHVNENGQEHIAEGLKKLHIQHYDNTKDKRKYQNSELSRDLKSSILYLEKKIQKQKKYYTNLLNVAKKSYLSLENTNILLEKSNAELENKFKNLDHQFSKRLKKEKELYILFHKSTSALKQRVYKSFHHCEQFKNHIIKEKKSLIKQYLHLTTMLQLKIGDLETDLGLKARQLKNKVDLLKIGQNRQEEMQSQIQNLKMCNNHLKLYCKSLENENKRLKINLDIRHESPRL